VNGLYALPRTFLKITIFSKIEFADIFWDVFFLHIFTNGVCK